MQNNNQTQDLTRTQIRNRNRRERLMGNQTVAQTVPVQGAANRRARLQQVRQDVRNRGRRVPLANAAMNVSAT